MRVSPAEHTSHAQSPHLIAFVDDIEALLRREAEPERRLRGVESRLTRLLAEPNWLAASYRAPSTERYRQHLLAVAPSAAFSVVALVWLPGQFTPIHDHICWCVVGVLEGVEQEQCFALREDAAQGRWLVPQAPTLLAPGLTTSLLPPDENIHQVRNAGKTLAISIHVYGADLRADPSSVNECFDGLPIRSDQTTGAPVAWRRVR